MKQWRLSKTRWDECQSFSLSKYGRSMIFQVEVLAAEVAEAASSAQEFGGEWKKRQK